MKKKITIAIAILAIIITAFQVSNHYAYSYDGGAPSGHANDPAGGSLNCTACHGGSAATVTGWITSNIPGTGYVPGTAYTITVTSTGTGGKKGFEVSPQSTSGTYLGTMTAGSGTGITATKYMRSTGSGITTNPKVWTFSWTAPATGLGPVNFYGAFAIGTGTTKITTYTVSESSVGINENKSSADFSIFPNPAVDNIYVTYSLQNNTNVTLNLYSADGKKVTELLNSEKTAGSYSDKININNLSTKGIFIVELKIGEKSSLQKLLVY